MTFLSWITFPLALERIPSSHVCPEHRALDSHTIVEGFFFPKASDSIALKLI